MLQLTISGQPVRLPATAAIKLTRENPALSEQGDYTLEVTVPLAGQPHNQRVFGPIHRPEAPLGPATAGRPFTLTAPHLFLQGAARVTSLTHREAKLQLLAGRSEANLNATNPDGTPIYIDQLPLGNIFDEYDLHAETLARRYKPIIPLTSDDTETLPDGTKVYVCHAIHTPADLALYFLHTGNDFQRQHGGPEHTSAVFHPIRSTTSALRVDTPAVGFPEGKESLHANAHINGLAADAYPGHITDGDDAPRADYRLDPCLLFNAWASGDGEGQTSFLAPQPRLLECLRRVLRAVGYTLDAAQAPDTRHLRSAVIANARVTVRYADILPHWTLHELLAEVRNFFRVTLIFRPDRTAAILPLEDFYAGAPQPQPRTADAHTADIDTQSLEGHILSGNADYDWPEEDPILRLPDEAYTHTQVRDFPTLTALTNYYSHTLTALQRQQSNHILRDLAARRTYASLQAHDTAAFLPTRADQYPPLIRQPQNPSQLTRLRIVPCRMEAPRPPDGEYPSTRQNIAHYTPRLLTSDTYAAVPPLWSVNTHANPQSPHAQEQAETTDPDKRDVIEVACATSHRRPQATVTLPPGLFLPPEQATNPIAAGVTLDTDPDTGLPAPIPAITGLPGTDNIGPWPLDTLRRTAAGTPDTADRAPAIDTRVTLRLTIIPQAPPDITRPILIRNRPHIIRTLEYTLTPAAHDPTLTATLHPIT